MTDIQVAAEAYRTAVKLCHTVDIHGIDLNAMPDGSIMAVFECRRCRALLSVNVIEVGGLAVACGPLLGAPDPMAPQSEYENNVCEGVELMTHNEEILQ